VTGITRRAALSLALAGGGVLGLGLAGGYLLRGAIRLAAPSDHGGMMGSASRAELSTYMELFNRHTELRRTVVDIPGGVRTTTESDAPELVAQLQAHVSSMYGHLDQGAEVTCMSDSLPALFRNAGGYRRQLALTSKGVTVTETSSDPALTRAILRHSKEVSGFVQEGMPAMMRGMMGG